VTYAIHLLQMLEEALKVSLFADRVEYLIVAHTSAID
jgi:hypothetical protein